MRVIVLMVVGFGLLSGCAAVSDSRFNPLNWGRGTAADPVPENIKPLVPESKKVQVVDNRVLVGSLSGLDVANVQGGVMVTATGQASVAGAFNAELVQTDIDDGVLTLAFRVQHPGTAVAGRPTQLSVGTFISNKTLAGVRIIRVISRTNTLSRRS